MIETFLRDLRQPEYIYVFTNSFRDFRCRLCARNVFRQIRTLELRNSARLVQSTHSQRAQLTR